MASLGPLEAFWEPLGGLLPLGGFLGASWRPLGASWGPLGPLGGLLGVLEVDLKLNIILEDLHFSGGPSWSCLGVFSHFFQAIFESILRDFKQPSSQ